MSEPVAGPRIGRACLATRDNGDPRRPAVSRALIDETKGRLDFRNDELGSQVGVTSDCRDTRAAQLDAELRGCEDGMRAWATEAGDIPHWLLGDEDGSAFRTVHDVCGRSPFVMGCRLGEGGAWVKHAQVCSLLAQLARTTHTRCQMWVVVFGEDNKCFTPQKMDLLSSEFWA
jgi:hypothetical protein